MPEELPETKTFAASVPYLMVLFALSLLGFLFLVLNAPLVADVLRERQYTNVAQLVTASIGRYRSAFLGSGQAGITPVLGGLFFLLPVGYVVRQVSGVLEELIQRIFALLLPRAPLLFSASRFTVADHGRLKIWLLENPKSKLEWEWEYFNYVIYWGIFTNAAAFLALCNFLLEVSGFGFWFLGIAIVLFLAAQALARSRTMLLVHDETRRLAGLSPRPEVIAAADVKHAGGTVKQRKTASK